MPNVLGLKGHIS